MFICPHVREAIASWSAYYSQAMRNGNLCGPGFIAWLPACATALMSFSNAPLCHCCHAECMFALLFCTCTYWTPAP